MSGLPVRSAAALIIGNELLTGKIGESNLPYLARELFSLGIALRRVVYSPDEVDVIATDLTALRTGHDHVFTSGGVGPTHDDVTIAAVARAFDRPVVRSKTLESMLRAHFGKRVTEHHLAMADVPEGAELVAGAAGRWPVLLVENVFVLPGLPEVFRRKLPLVRERLAGQAEPFISRAVRTKLEEPELAGMLRTLASEHPNVQIGSYPRFGGSDPFRVTLTFDGRDPEAVRAAVNGLLAHLPVGSAQEVASES